ncbi:MAG: hypothetical protein ACRD4Q_16500, partial [Candidatus Acidiferrales bacterium]
IDCVVYNYYGNVANPTTCAVPSQGTGDDGNALGKLDLDYANASLSHTLSLAYDPTHRLTSAAATGSSTYNLAFSYDRFGNMTCRQNQNTQGLCPQYGFSARTLRLLNHAWIRQRPERAGRLCLPRAAGWSVEAHRLDSE